MQKSATSHFDVKTGRIVRHDLTNGKKMNDTVENGAGEAEAATAANARNDKRVKMTFLNEKGEGAHFPQEGCRAIHADLKEVGEEDMLDLRKLCDDDGKPLDMLFRLAAFGASTLGRNEVNTSLGDNAAEDGATNLKARWEGFRNGSYRKTYTGSATPLVIEALEAAYIAQGIAAETIAEKVASWRAKYNAADAGDDKAQAKARRDVTKTLLGVAEVRAQADRIEAERKAKRIAALPQKSLADL